MKVGLNLLYLEPRSGGAGTYARELIGALLEAAPDTRITAFVGAEAPAWLDEQPWSGEVDFVRFGVTVTHGPPGNFVRLMGTQWGAVPALAARRGLDVVHGLANVAPLLAPRVATVVTVLDLIWLRHPQTLDARARRGMKHVTFPSARRADRVIAISESSRQDLIENIGLDPARVDVTHLGFRPDAPHAAPAPEADLRARLGLGDGPVVLSVGQKREHKNQLGLIRAMASVPGATLVLPGAPTPFEATLREAASELPVVFPDWLDDNDLEGLYRLASAFVLPSFEEGFGLPVLEAMGRGVPVACSDLSSLPEVAGDAALLFDPHDPDSIAAAVQRLLGDDALREDLRRRGAEQARRFPWRATAEATLASYWKAIG